MNFMDPQKVYGLTLGIFMIVCFGAMILGTIVTSESRSHSGDSPFPMIIGILIFMILGWMCIDYFLLPQYHGLAVKEFARQWLTKKLH